MTFQICQPCESRWLQQNGVRLTPYGSGPRQAGR